jgi:outer membrane lipoprotein SlyB
MISSPRSLALAIAAAASMLGACAQDPYYYRDYGSSAYPASSAYPQSAYPPVASQNVEYGVVEAIEWHRDGDPRPTGLGAVIGGIAGGILGHQIGSGTGNTVATIAGALGGAYAGNQVERATDRDRYRVIVRLDNGGRVSVGEVGEGQLRVGDRVRIAGNRVYRT